MTEATNGQAEVAGSLERTIRPHHVDVLSKVIFRLVRSDGCSLEEICLDEAAATEKLAHSYPVDPWETYREKHGYEANNTSVPASYLEDVEGNDPDGLISRMANTYYELLTLPDTTRVTVTPSIDDICKQTAYGNGTGGLHCHTVWRAGEDWDSKVLRMNIREYLKYPKVQALQEADPARYQVSVDKAPIDCALRVLSPNKEALRTKMSLGLLRDVMTFSETLFTRPLFLSFKDLLASKGIVNKKGL